MSHQCNHPGLTCGESNALLLNNSADKRSRWLRFVKAGDTGKTIILDVESKTQGGLLGQIKWLSRWRQYAFFPCRDTAFNQECLADIIDKMQRLMAAR